MMWMLRCLAAPVLRPVRQEPEPQVAVEQSPSARPATPPPAIEQTEIVFKRSGMPLPARTEMSFSMSLNKMDWRS